MAILLIFCEYTIPDAYLAAFRAWAASRPSRWEGAQLLESRDQPGVMLEIRQVDGEREAARIEEERLGGRSDWHELEQWVKGGHAGIRVWTFRPYSFNG